MQVVFVTDSFFVPALFMGNIKRYLEEHELPTTVNRGNTRSYLVKRGRIYKPHTKRQERVVKKRKGILCPGCGVVLDFIPYDLNNKKCYCSVCGMLF